MKPPPRCSSRCWACGFGGLAVALAVFLLVADHPGEISRDIAKRVADGKKPAPESDFALGLWWAALANLILSLALASAGKVWARPLPGPDEGRGIPAGRWARGFGWALVAVVLLGGVMRWNLASRSLWWDELWPVKYGVVGYYLGDPGPPLEERRFAEGSWQRSLWHYTRPMNHPAASFPARLSHVVWRTLARPAEPHRFSESALRFPNGLASLAAIGAVGLLGARWGFPLGGILAALILAVHPWHIRYGIDLRGYSWMILWTAAGLFWLTLLFQRASRSAWLPWWGFGVNQALLVWSFPYAGAVAAAFAGLAAALVARAWTYRSDRWTGWLRLGLVNLVAAMLFLQVFAPNLLQMSRWYESVTEHHEAHRLTAERFLTFLAQWLTGSPWAQASIPEAEGLVGLSGRVSRPLALGLLAGLGAVMAAGWGRLWRRDRTLAGVVSAPLVAGALMLTIFAVTVSYFYPRFLTFLLIPMVLLTGVACDWQSTGSRHRVLLAAAVAGGLTWLMAPQWGLLMARPYAPMRDVAAVLESQPEPVLKACFGHGGEMLPVYVPDLRSPASLDELKDLIEEARSRGVGLVVAYGYGPFNRAMIPDGFAWLDDPDRFEEIAVRRGIEPDFCFRVLRWKGGG